MSEAELPEPREEDLPDKPDLPEADLPEDGDDVSDAEPIELGDAEFKTPGEASQDPTVDDTELDLGGDDPPADPLPGGGE